MTRRNNADICLGNMLRLNRLIAAPVPNNTCPFKNWLLCGVLYDQFPTLLIMEILHPGMNLPESSIS